MVYNCIKRLRFKRYYNVFFFLNNYYYFLFHLAARAIISCLELVWFELSTVFILQFSVDIFIGYFVSLWTSSFLWITWKLKSQNIHSILIYLIELNLILFFYWLIGIKTKNVLHLGKLIIEEKLNVNLEKNSSNKSIGQYKHYKPL